jgi:hypothetical protein
VIGVATVGGGCGADFLDVVRRVGGFPATNEDSFGVERGEGFAGFGVASLKDDGVALRRGVGGAVGGGFVVFAGEGDFVDFGRVLGDFAGGVEDRGGVFPRAFPQAVFSVPLVYCNHVDRTYE